MTLFMGVDYVLSFSIPQTELLAGTTIELVSPVNGFINDLNVVVQTAVTTGGDIDVKIGTDDVPDLTVTIADAATKGTVVKKSVSGAGRAVKVGDRIQIVPAAEFATAGAVNGNLVINTGK